MAGRPRFYLMIGSIVCDRERRPKRAGGIELVYRILHEIAALRKTGDACASPERKTIR